MSVAWIVVLVTGAATVALKGLGPLALGGRRLPDAAGGVLALLAPTLLAALVATQTFADGRHLVLDARAAGVAAACIAVALRAPVLVVVISAAATAALLRALG
jgi:branched-subunit amino acid transport protein